MTYRYETSHGQKGIIVTTSDLETLLESLQPQECILIDRMSEADVRQCLSDSMKSRPSMSAFLRAQVLSS